MLIKTVKRNFDGGVNAVCIATSVATNNRFEANRIIE